MSLVGDIIMELRSRIPDAPAVQNIPGFTQEPPNGVVPIFDPNGQFVPGQTITVAVTGTNQWGETGLGNGVNLNPSFLRTVTITPGTNALSVQVSSAGPPWLLYTNLYLASVPGGVTDPAQFFPKLTMPATPQATYILTGSLQSLPPGATFGFSNAPIRNTAFHPDSDGNFIGAYTAYRLLNRALQEMVRIAGGIIDVTGVQSQVNQSMYRIDTPSQQGQFYQFVNAWYDGYPMDVVQRSQMYLRNSAAGFSGILSYEQDGPQSVIQVWPQSNRTGGSAFMLGSIFGQSGNFFVNDASGFLSIGLAQIDNEIVSYSNIQKLQGNPFGGTFYEISGVTRGMGGTDAVDHDTGAPVTELNIRLSGYRMARPYNVGDAMLPIQVPQAWETPLVLHMLSQVRSMEQDEAASKQLQGDFVQMADKIAKQSRMGKLKPRQIPIWGQNVSDARNVNGIGFGWLIN